MCEILLFIQTNFVLLSIFSSHVYHLHQIHSLQYVMTVLHLIERKKKVHTCLQCFIVNRNDHHKGVNNKV